MVDAREVDPSAGDVELHEAAVFSSRGSRRQYKELPKEEELPQPLSVHPAGYKEPTNWDQMLEDVYARD